MNETRITTCVSRFDSWSSTRNQECSLYKYCSRCFERCLLKNWLM